ncbi:MAG TPA: hypothetical protein VGZ22_19090 [Isosphaeraceae bacterium]|jgi:hypothetical protein|nr:hypothetical protein [Isosphaeraceae bacterium]
MSNAKRAENRARYRRKPALRVEALEPRALLAAAAETFTGPSLADLIQLAQQGKNTASAGINRMLQALQTQLDSGPLADLNAGTVNGTDFVTEVQNLETSFAQNVDQQLSPEFPNVDKLLKLQGQRIVADVTALNQQSTVGLISSSALATQAQTAINSLTGGPIFSLGTPLSAYVTRTQSFETNLNTLAQSLSSTASPALTVAQVNTTLQAEAEAYRADLHAGLQVTHPNISAMVDSAVTTLENASTTIAQGSGTNAQAQLMAAITAFDNAILDTTGLFGPQGVISKSQARDRDN